MKETMKETDKKLLVKAAHDGIVRFCLNVGIEDAKDIRAIASTAARRVSKMTVAGIKAHRARLANAALARATGPAGFVTLDAASLAGVPAATIAGTKRVLAMPFPLVMNFRLR